LDVAGPNAPLSLKLGRDLHELEDVFAAAGASVINPIFYLNKDEWGDFVPARDRIDLTCGCKIFYPDSRGGKK
jgi:hypothetical protein